MELLALLYIVVGALIGLLALSILSMIFYELSGIIFWLYAIGFYALWIYIIRVKSWYPKTLIRFAIEWGINILYIVFSFGHSFNFYGSELDELMFLLNLPVAVMSDSAASEMLYNISKKLDITSGQMGSSMALIMSVIMFTFCIKTIYDYNKQSQ